MTRSSALTVREITSDQHLAAIAERPSVSFLQTPAWGVVKRDWRSRSVGWFDGDKLVGVALVLYRKAPRVRRYLAYVPEGPSIDWDGISAVGDLQRWLAPLVEHVKAQGAFGLRMGPRVVGRRWSNATLKSALADPGVARLRDVPADETTATGTALAEQLTALGWRPPAEVDGFAAGQPRHVFQLPLEGRSEDDVLKGFNQLWRRNIKKADKSGVVVSLGTVADLPEFHRIYAETAQRDAFTPRPLSYFEGMWAAMTGEAPERLRLYLAHHEGDLVAAATMTRVGTHAWYSYGASTTTKRDVRGSNAIQWRMMRDALAEGCAVYDLRGITDTLSEDDPHAGLIRFKLGTGGHAVEYVGEWDLPISRVLYSAFDLYMKRRS
ncbi:lipid II:glycine glycyltransferase FemX [Jiangella alba]|uniref:Lipid II:glycine glycyltransferase (Peptidoglycan interpeptide bridge formation enzyme) n=1 Tax=Jiangella alba TaxID=561176 RepID=A0A1H5PMT6_9ACTN|nr:peptidoglycan bridge formation glycyltransferase FemA/FemB family protein [Jiangella alba]SEF15009.1 Lipid II:glycine glycyltransferase (Peptidoglycan interpeptide bridge formation enzyme) [Jiangella alba]